MNYIIRLFVIIFYVTQWYLGIKPHNVSELQNSKSYLSKQSKFLKSTLVNQTSLITSRIRMKFLIYKIYV